MYIKEGKIIMLERFLVKKLFGFLILYLHKEPINMMMIT